MNIQRALVIGAGGNIGSATADALAREGVGVTRSGRERDAADAEHVEALLEESDPDLVVVAVGATPRMAPIDEQTWESFSEPWTIDTRVCFEVARATLRRPLRRGSTVITVSSGAAIDGSPLSGGYAPAKRAQVFISDYLQRRSDALDLGIRFATLLPRQFVAATTIGERAAEAYGRQAGRSAEAVMAGFDAPLEAADVAEAIVSMVSAKDARHLGIRGTGVAPITDA